MCDIKKYLLSSLCACCLLIQISSSLSTSSEETTDIIADRQKYCYELRMGETPLRDYSDNGDLSDVIEVVFQLKDCGTLYTIPIYERVLDYLNVIENKSAALNKKIANITQLMENIETFEKSHSKYNEVTRTFARCQILTEFNIVNTHKSHATMEDALIELLNFRYGSMPQFSSVADKALYEIYQATENAKTNYTTSHTQSELKEISQKVKAAFAQFSREDNLKHNMESYDTAGDDFTLDDAVFFYLKLF